MALLAQISAFPTQTTPGVPVAFQCVIYNNGASTVSVADIQPIVRRSGGVLQHAAFNVSKPPLGPGFTTSIPTRGVATFRFGGFMGDPTSGDGGTSPGTATYEVGATVQSSDGSTSYAAICTITSVPYDSRQRTGNGSYGPGLSTQSPPALPALPSFPSLGAFQQNYWANSALFPVVL